MGGVCEAPKKDSYLGEKLEEARVAYRTNLIKWERVLAEVEEEVDGTDGMGLRQKMHKKKMLQQRADKDGDGEVDTDFEKIREELFEEKVKLQIEKHRHIAIEEATQHHGHADHGVGQQGKARRGSVGGVPHPEVAALGHRVHVAITGKCADVPEDRLTAKGYAMHGMGAIEELTEDYLAGVRCLKGSSPVVIRPNQDDFFFVATADMYRVMGVLDGHGEFGHAAAALVRDHIMRTLLAELPFDRHEDEAVYNSQIAKAMTDAFKAANEELMHQKDVDVRLSGVTASIVVHDIKQAYIHVAWAGNLRCVIADLADEDDGDDGPRRGNKRNLVASALTVDHTTKVEDELKRVTDAGAQVTPTKYGDEINVPGERFPGMPVTRCIGNKVAHCIGVTHEPSIHHRPVKCGPKEGRFIVMGTDGLWDVVRNSEIIVTIHECRKNNLEFAMEHAMAKAKDGWEKKAAKQGDVMDDFTIGLMYLHGFEIVKDDEPPPA